MMASDPSMSSLPSADPLDFEDLMMPFTSNEIFQGHEIEREGTPEPLTPNEMDVLLQKANEMLAGGNMEVAKMIQRLVSTAPTPSQVQSQAETIAELCRQRDFLMERQEEERQRWQTERDEWNRTSEILLARANIEGGRSRELQLEHRNNNVLSENTSLKNKLNYSTERITYLESEIAQLKPLLLMQPINVIQSYPHPSPPQPPPFKAKQPPTAEASVPTNNGPSPKADNRKAAEEPLAGVEEEAPSASDAAKVMQEQRESSAPEPLEPKTPINASSALPIPPVTPTPAKPNYYRSFPSTTPAGNYINFNLFGSPTRPKTAVSQYQIPPGTPGTSKTSATGAAPPQSPSKSTAPGSPGKAKPKTKNKPSSADARTEHLIMAARRLGRERAAMLSGMYIPPVTYYAYPGGYHPMMGMYPQPPPYPGGMQPHGHVPMFSPMFAQGGAQFGFQYPTTPPPKGRNLSVASGSQNQLPSAQRKGANNYYPNVAPGRRSLVDGQPRGSTSKGAGAGPSASDTNPSKQPTTPRARRKVPSKLPNSASRTEDTQTAQANIGSTPSALDSLLSAAKEVLSSPTTPSASASARRKRRRLLPPSDLEDDDRSGEDGGAPPIVGIGEGIDLTPTLAESSFAARRRNRTERDQSPTPELQDTNGAGGSNGRFSALDVLASQATIYQSHSQESQSSSAEDAESEEDNDRMDVVGHVDGVGEKTVGDGIDDSETPRARGKVKKMKDKGKGKAREPISPGTRSGEGSEVEKLLGAGERTNSSRTHPEGEETDADADGEADVELEVEDGTQPIQTSSRPSSRMDGHSSSKPPTTGTSPNKQTVPSLDPPISLTSNPTMPFIPVHPGMMGFAPPNGGSHPALGAYTTVFYGNKPFAIPYSASFTSSTSGSGSATSKLAASHSLPPSFGSSAPHLGAATGSAAGGKSFIHHEPTTGKRVRSPYTKWTPEEDVLLEKAVTKYGMKWDLVQKDLPNRGYHQVRQRWLRKQHTAKPATAPAPPGQPAPPVQQPTESAGG